MSKRILIDAAHPEEVRVALVGAHNRLEELDIETATKENLKGNIYLARITRVEPSLQAAFVEYGGNRHGFLPFSEIHPDYFQISAEQRQSIEAALKEKEQKKAAAAQKHADDDPLLGDNVDTESEDVVQADDHTAHLDADVERPAVAKMGGDLPPDLDEEEAAKFRIFASHFQIQDVIRNNQIVLIQISKEERGGKGAALTTYLALAGRYCVLMPNTTGSGGVSRKIVSSQDRRRLKDLIDGLNLPHTMGLIIRTAGGDRSKEEIRGDARYLCRLWEKIRQLTLASTAPALIYEEPNLIQRSIRDLLNKDVDKILVEGAEAYQMARAFMQDLVPTHINRLSLFRNQGTSLLQYFNVEDQIDEMRLPRVTLASGGSLVINQTEALVAIDINSGKSTKSQHIKETALKTNLEAADEIARQLRLRDLAGLIVIDFIDMDEASHVRQVEQRMRDVMAHDRARVQIGQISNFGLLEMSRQRMRPSIIESSYIQCAQCKGTGVVRSTSASAIEVLRAISEVCKTFEGDVLNVLTPREVSYYLLNYKRDKLYEIEQTHGKMIIIKSKSTLVAPEYEFEHMLNRAQPALRPHQATQTEAEAVLSSRKRATRPQDAPPVQPTHIVQQAIPQDSPAALVTETVQTAAPGPLESPSNGSRRRGRRGGRQRRGSGGAANGNPLEAPGRPISPGRPAPVAEKKKSWWQKLIS